MTDDEVETAKKRSPKDTWTTDSTARAWLEWGGCRVKPLSEHPVHAQQPAAEETKHNKDGRNQRPGDQPCKACQRRGRGSGLTASSGGIFGVCSWLFSRHYHSIYLLPEPTHSCCVAVVLFSCFTSGRRVGAPPPSASAPALIGSFFRQRRAATPILPAASHQISQTGHRSASASLRERELGRLHILRCNNTPARPPNSTSQPPN